MRLHVICHGKKTTISIDDILMDYLGAWLVEADPKLHVKAKVQHTFAQDYIKRYIAKMGDRLPTKNISQNVQAFIIRSIAAPGLEEIIKARGPRYKKEKLDLSSLIPDFDAQVAAMKSYLDKNQLPT